MSRSTNQPAAVDCRCIDCGGNQPGHDPTCSYMRELHGEQPAAEVEALRAEVERLQRQLRQAHKDYGCELRDPNGTIWEYAAMQRDRAERLAGALRHQRWCRTCGEDGWDSCEEGRAAIDLLQAAYKEETND